MKQKPRLRAIAAMSLNRVIGRNGGIPWHIPDEFRWFKQTTTGHTVLMGRKTYESIGRPLPNRRNLVVSRSGDIPGVETLTSLEGFDPERFAPEGKDVFVLGGAQIYSHLLPQCDDLLLTVIPREMGGDAFFPAFEDSFILQGKVLSHPEFEVFHYTSKHSVKNG
jgi:dihydrofolate reductase